jgi:hypothetical protein
MAGKVKKMININIKSYLNDSSDQNKYIFRVKKDKNGLSMVTAEKRGFCTRIWTIVKRSEYKLEMILNTLRLCPRDANTLECMEAIKKRINVKKYDQKHQNAPIKALFEQVFPKKAARADDGISSTLPSPVIHFSKASQQHLAQSDFIEKSCRSSEKQQQLDRYTRVLFSLEKRMEMQKTELSQLKNAEEQRNTILDEAINTLESQIKQCELSNFSCQILDDHPSPQKGYAKLIPPLKNANYALIEKFQNLVAVKQASKEEKQEVIKALQGSIEARANEIAHYEARIAGLITPSES